MVEESLRRHAGAPYLYEELTLLSSDAAGRYTVRTARHYVRPRDGGEERLLVIDTPHEARGSAVLVRREADGAVHRDVVLPALAVGPAVSEKAGAADELAPEGPLFGTDFLLADLEEENPARFRYEADGETDIDRVPHFVVRALPAVPAAGEAPAGAERRLYLRKDNLFVSRVEYSDRQGRPARRQSFRDPRAHDSGAWRAAMILMENLRDGHRTLIKVERRVHSADYVPAEVFRKPMHAGSGP
ncbi:MAG: outer membrane lipoprotein-sorting protein [Betaproteobacteria bacterium]